MSSASAPVIPQSSAFNSTRVSNSSFTQVSSFAGQSFISTGDAPAIPTSVPSSVSLDSSIVPVSSAPALTSASASSFLASSAVFSSSFPPSLSSDTSSAVVSSSSVSVSLGVTSRTDLSTQPGIPAESTSTSASLSLSVSSASPFTSLPAVSSPAKSAAITSTHIVSASASFGRVVVSASPVSRQPEEVIVSTSSASAMSTPTPSSATPVTDKNPTPPETQPASPAKSSTPAANPSDEATSQVSESSKPTPAPSPPASLTSEAEPSSSSKPVSQPSSPSTPAPSKAPTLASSQAPSRATDIATPSATPSSQAGQSPSSGPSDTVEKAQPTPKASAVSQEVSYPSPEVSRVPAVINSSLAFVEDAPTSSADANSSRASRTSAASTKGSPTTLLTHVVQTSAPSANVKSAAPSAATGSPAISASGALSSSTGSDVSSFRGQANAETATATSTITDNPETTLSTPSFVTTTDSSGHTTVSLPPFFNSVAVSTLPDGELITTTHVIANPTGIWGVDDNAAVHRGFFTNTGAVAGVFLVVGIVVASLIATGFFFICKNRRRQRIRHSISRPLPYPDNPFEDPRDSPSPTQMRYATEASRRNLVGSGLGVSDARPRSFFDHDGPDSGSHGTTIYSTGSSTQQANLIGLAGVGAGGRSVGRPDYNGPFSDHHNARPGHQHKPSMQSSAHSEVGLAITTDQTQYVEGSPLAFPASTHLRPPSAQSSPSIYPASLPPVPTEETERAFNSEPSGLPPPPAAPPVPPQRRHPPFLNLQKQEAADQADQVPPMLSAKTPILPPRNPLRTSQHEASKLLIRTSAVGDQFSQLGFKTYEPLTPPASTPSSESHHSDGTSPYSTGSEKRNPFSDLNISDEKIKDQNIPSPVRDTFYTRRKISEIRPSSSLEWKQQV